MSQPTRRAAVYGMPFDQVGGGQLHQAILADALTGAYQVDLLHHVPGLTREDVRRHYAVDLERVTLRYVDPIPAEWPYPAASPTSDRDSFEIHRELTEPYDLFASVVVGPPIRSYARRGLLNVLFPFVGREHVWPWLDADPQTRIVKRFIRNAYYGRRWRSVFRSYEHRVAISAFTARWTRHRWGIEAEVMYPLVMARFADKPKTKTILSVGRFSRHGTQKKQLEMVRAFTQAHDTLLSGWEYVCVGGLTDDPDDQRYYQEVCEAARGYPVRLVANAPAGVIEGAYEQAAVFWHAAGYDEDDARHPEHTEHFGMSTVEAMAAGCVPVAIRKGGQPEIVEHGLSGFLWDDLDELVAYTHRLDVDDQVRDTMAAEARRRARRFTDRDAFRVRLLRIVNHGQ